MEWPGKFKDLRFRWLKVKNPKNKLYRMNWLVTSKKGGKPAGHKVLQPIGGLWNWILGSLVI